LLGDLLRDVSRSFYLSLTILPGDVREPIGLAYLLARASDSVADTRLVPRSARLTYLTALRRAYAGDRVDVHAIAAACGPGQTQPGERRLLERVHEATARVDRLREPDRAQVRRVLSTITSGQIFDLERFPGEDATALAALSSRADLDRYTYLVAGCVGEFWTALHVAHRPALAGWDLERMSAEGVRFGKALQLTNVLRDVPGDLRAGRCYLPADELDRLGLEPRDLLDPARTRSARPLLMELLEATLSHYDVAWRYTTAIPRREWRMRLACAWPLLIGLATLGAFARQPDPLAAGPIKISRAEVRHLLARSAFSVWSNRMLAADAARLRSRVVAKWGGAAVAPPR
jgi:farnesyl-diphosphate farnesyltransferase